MLELYRNIKKERLQKGMSQSELAKKVGYTDRSMIAKIESGNVDLSQSKIESIAKALGTTSANLMGWDDDIDPFQFDNIKPISTQKIPLIGEIACGNPIVAYEELESYIEAGTNIKADYCLRCKGDSMINARIFDGDIVFIKKQDYVNNGEIATVIIDGEVTLKRVYHYKEKNILILKPENSACEDMVYSGTELEQIRILGKAIAFQSDVK